MVTGGAGFIGSHLIEELVRRGERVRAIDNFLTGKRANIEPFMNDIEFIDGDIRDVEACRRAVEGVDYVLHQAALPSVPRSIENPLLTNEINVGGTLNLLKACVDAGVKRIVFASSSSVYGDDPGLPKKEGREGIPLSPYAVTKIVGEKYCQVFGRVYSLSSACLRYFNIFGPRQDPYSQYAAVIPNFIVKILRKESPTVFGDGEQTRDFTYVANVVEANLLAAKASPDFKGEAINIACGERTSVNVLAEAINEITGSSVEPVYEPPRAGDIRHSYADISKAKKCLPYRVKVSFRDGLERTIEWDEKKEG